MSLACAGICPKVMHMKEKIIALVAFLLFAPGVLAQLRVEVVLEQETYLPHESLPIKVVVRNSSGQSLKLGDTDEWLTFSLENTDGSVVTQVKPVDVRKEFTIPSAHRANVTFDLAPSFDLTKFGRYLVTATVKVPQWNQVFSSRSHAFGISPGVTLWETVYGIPSKEGQPEFRRYQLVQANHKKHLSLYARITDQSETETFKVFPLGPVISFSRPEAMLDTWSNLHVLWQYSAQGFRYSVITPDGMLLARETHDQTSSRPVLAAASKGGVKVSGGTRRVSGTDLPPPDLASESKKDEPIEAAEYIKSVDGKSKEK